MKADAVILGVSGALFGVIVGWMLGVQQYARSTPTPTPAATTAAASPQPAQGQPTQGQPTQGQAAPSAGRPGAAPLDTARVQQLEAEANGAPRDADVRIALGNAYFDADRFADAARWYEAALAIDTRNVDTSTDLAIAYYYLGQAPRAIRQLEASLAIDPRHTKTLLNLGIVRAFGTQDLRGAAEAWQQVVAHAPPDSPEGRAARQALEGLKSAHPDIAAQAAPRQGS